MISTILKNDELHELRAEWTRLWSRTSGATPFQSPEWLLPWWNHFGSGSPIVTLQRSEGTLTGLLPLYYLPDESKVLPVGVGLSDYFDALGDSRGLLDAGLASVSDPRAVCHLVDIRPTSHLVGATIPSWTTEWIETIACPVLTLPNIPTMARRKLRMNQSRAQRSGGWVVETASLETLDYHLNGLIRLHQSRWRARGESGVLSDRRVLAFWHEAAPGLLSAGLLRLCSIKIAGEQAAAIAALLAPDRIFFYLSGFDESYAFVSPGTILLGAMLEEAIAEGRSEAHFLRGRERYKYQWGAQDRLNWAGHFTRVAKSAQR